MKGGDGGKKREESRGEGIEEGVEGKGDEDAHVEPRLDFTKR